MAKKRAKRDENSFIFSLNNKKKYKIINPENAIGVGQMIGFRLVMKVIYIFIIIVFREEVELTKHIMIFHQLMS